MKNIKKIRCIHHYLRSLRVGIPLGSGFVYKLQRLFQIIGLYAYSTISRSMCCTDVSWKVVKEHVLAAVVLRLKPGNLSIRSYYRTKYICTCWKVPTFRKISQIITH